MTSNGGGDYLGFYDILEKKKKVCPYMIKPKCLHWIPVLYCLSHFLIGLCLFHFQTIIGAVLLQGIELAQRLMADTLCSLGLYKSDLLPPRSRNRWVGIRLPAWSTTVQESDSGVVVCCLTCRLQESKPSSIPQSLVNLVNAAWVTMKVGSWKPEAADMCARRGIFELQSAVSPWCAFRTGSLQPWWLYVIYDILCTVVQHWPLSHSARSSQL